MLNKAKLRGKIVEKQYTIDKLSELMGINPATFYRKTTGESEFTRIEIKMIAEALSLTAQDVADIFFAD